LKQEIEAEEAQLDRDSRFLYTAKEQRREVKGKTFLYSLFYNNNIKQ
jgi:hypothetical protein